MRPFFSSCNCTNRLYSTWDCLMEQNKLNCMCTLSPRRTNTRADTLDNVNIAEYQFVQIDTPNPWISPHLSLNCELSFYSGSLFSLFTQNTIWATKSSAHDSRHLDILVKHIRYPKKSPSGSPTCRPVSILQQTCRFYASSWSCPSHLRPGNQPHNKEKNQTKK